MKSFPTISIVIPTYNEEKNIGNCLDSIIKQNYPKDKLEIIIIDDDSNDKTVDIVKKYPVKILRNGYKHGEVGKMIGFKKAKGDFFMYLDADNELIGDGWFQKMLMPLLDNKDIVGSFTFEGARKTDSPIERYLSFDPLQRDSIYQYFSPSIDKVVEEKRDNYWVCAYKLDIIPPAGRCLYRRKEIQKIISGYKMFLELDFLVLLVKNGLNKFAYVPDAGLYHHHASSLVQLIKKRKYNLTKVYFKHVENNLYTWFDLKTPKDLLKIIIWIVYANLIIPSVAVGVYKFLKYKDLAAFYEPLVNVLVTDVIVFTFLTHYRGRALLKFLN